MELEYFVYPGNDEEWHDKWVELRLAWWEAQGVPKEKIKLLDVEGEELAHYSKKTVDLMYEFPHGLEELEGIANRTDFDLGSHSKNQEDLEIKSKIAKIENISLVNNDPHQTLFPIVSLEETYKSGLPSFAFVRHPVDRLYSCWKDKVATQMTPEFSRFRQFYSGMSFHQFVQSVETIPDLSLIHI